MTTGWRWRGSIRDRVQEEGHDSNKPAFDPDWVQAKPASIKRSLDAALSRSGRGWFVLDASARISSRPRRFEVSGQELVAWRDGDQLRAAPAACPHMGASLEGAKLCGGRPVCPWHGLVLGPEGHGGWHHLPAYDDGVLSWIRLGEPAGEPGSDSAAERPTLPSRPEVFFAGVIRLEARCEPRDVLQNRLDPWHGAHFHPYSFGDLEVLEDTPEKLVLRVEKRILGPLRVEVKAQFDCPDERTIVMTILDGEGAGSTVETHATPISQGRTAIVEATLATSARPGFRFARRVAPLVRPLLERSARRLWVDDAAYAERLFELRGRENPSSRGPSP